jgi:alanine dehydrogenase
MGVSPLQTIIGQTKALRALQFGMDIANKGYKQAVRDNPGLAKGVNVVDGKVTYRAVADSLGLEYTPLEEVLR